MDTIHPNLTTPDNSKPAIEWRENTEIIVRNFPLKVNRQISEGLTGYIYSGFYRDRDVVIKVMKTDTGVDIRPYFVQEGRNIQDIRRHWKASWPDQDPVVPEIFVDENNIAEPFLIMERLQGRNFEQMVEDGQKLGELEGLALGTQIGKLLCVLHEGLKKCYADIKFDNFWRLDKPDDKGLPLLRVIDWNILSDQDEAKSRRDIFYVTTYIFSLLTGVTLELRGLQVRTHFTNLQAFQQLTFATQQFFKRALHTDSSKRFNNARDWLAQLVRLQGWWDQEAMSLNVEAGKELDAAQNAQANQKYEEALASFNKARSVLEISDRKGRGNQLLWQNFDNRIKEGLVSTSVTEVGLNFLKSWQFEEAQSRFRKGYEMSMDEMEREGMLRWFWLSAAALRMGREVFRAFEQDSGDGSNELITAVQALINGESLKTEEILKRACSRLNPVPAELAALRDEAQLINLANRAQSSEMAGDYDQIAANYKQAFHLAEQLPQNPRTSWGFGLNIFDLWQSSLKDANTIGEAQKTLDKAKQAVAGKNYNQASEYFVAAQKAAEEYPETANEWKKDSADVLREGNIHDLLSLTRGAFGLAGAKDVLVYWQVGQEIRKIGQLVEQGRLDDAITKIEAYCAGHTGSPEMLGNVFQSEVRKAADLAASRLDIKALDRMLVPAVSHELSVREAIRAKIKDVDELSQRKRKNQIEEYRQQIITYLNKESYPDFIKAKKLSDDLRSFLNKEELPEYQNIFEKIEKQGSTLEIKIEQQKSTSQKRLSEISTSLEKIDSTIKKSTELMEMLDLNNMDERRLYDIKVDILMRLAQDGLVLISEWLQLAPDDTSQDKRREWYEVMLVPSYKALSQIRDRVSERINIPIRLVSEAKGFYEQGKISDCVSRIELIENTYQGQVEIGDLKQKAQEVDRFITWINAFNNKLGSLSVSAVSSDSGLQDWFQRKIPAVYWRKFGQPLVEWTNQQVSHPNLDAFLRMDRSNMEKIFSRLVEFIAASRLNRILQGLGSSQGVAEAVGGYGEEDLVQFIGKLFSKDISDRLNQRGELLEITQGFGPNQPLNPREMAAKVRQRDEQGKHRPVIIAAAAGGILLVAFLALILTRTGPFTAIYDFIITPTPTPTATPTLTPTTPPPPPPAEIVIPPQTPQPVATFTPIPTPTSVYNYLSETEIPVLPSGVTPLFLIDASDSNFPNKGWIVSEDSTDGSVGQKLYYAQSPMDSKAIFQMDVPFEKAGIYEIFYHDAKNNCGHSGEIEFQVQLVEGSVPLIPVQGSNKGKLKFSADQTASEWLSLGLYYLNSGDRIQLIVDPLTNWKDNKLCADAILIGLVSDSYFINKMPLLAQKPEGEIVLWGDDSDSGTLLNPAIDQWAKVDVPDRSWLGYSTIKFPLPDPANVPQLSWILPHKLYAGKYDVYTIVPEALKGAVSFDIKLDGTDVIPPVTFDTGNAQVPLPPFFKLATIEITDSTLPNILTVSVKPVDATKEGVLAVDAVLVLKSPE